jgi:hypothetical protein
LKSVQLKDAPEPVDPIAEHVRAIIQNLGEDITRGGLAATPQRYAKALRYLARGYAGDVESAIGNGVFPAEGASPVLVRDIQFYSLCVHDRACGARRLRRLARAAATELTHGAIRTARPPRSRISLGCETLRQ